MQYYASYSRLHKEVILDSWARNHSCIQAKQDKVFHSDFVGGINLENCSEVSYWLNHMPTYEQAAHEIIQQWKDSHYHNLALLKKKTKMGGIGICSMILKEYNSFEIFTTYNGVADPASRSGGY